MIAQNLRGLVRDWRDAYYAGASETTRQLLGYWFEESHRVISAAGDEFEFRYYFAQREALETFVCLREVRGINKLSELVAQFSIIRALKDDGDRQLVNR